MTLKVLLALLLALLSTCTRAQSSPAARQDATVVRTFYLTNVSRPDDANDLVTALRVILPTDVRIVYVPTQQALTFRGTPDQIELAQKLLHDLDRPRKPYRLTYTITEMDNGKRIGTQHIAVVVLSGGRTTLKQGSKVPVATGSYNPGTSGTQTQFTYLDIGLNIDASLDDAVDGVRLRTKVEQSSLAEEKSALGTQDPIVRQTVFEGTSILTVGKPLMLGTLDIPSSTRRLDIEVIMEPVH